MLAHEHHKTMRSRALGQCFESKSRCDLRVRRGTVARKENKSERSIGGAHREREIEAKIDARKVLVEDTVTWNSGIDLCVKRDPSVKGRHHSSSKSCRLIGSQLRRIRMRTRQRLMHQSHRGQMNGGSTSFEALRTRRQKLMQDNQ